MKRALKPTELFDTSQRYSQGIAVDGAKGLLFIAGQTATDLEGNIVGVGDIRAQTRKAFENVGSVLRTAGLDYGHLVKLNVYLTMLAHREPYGQVRMEILPKEQRPVGTLLIVAGLARPELLIEIEGIAAY